jgi:transaldolase
LAGTKIKIFADGASLPDMVRLYANPLIRGFTTNPTLLRKAGVIDYGAFARRAVAAIPDRPISFEVLSDEPAQMEREALAIAGWGAHVYVKIPITNTRGEPMMGLVARLSERGVKVNVTAVLTLEQVRAACAALAASPGGYISIFAGRIADTGRDPVPVIRQAGAAMAANERLELIWASPRELLNVYHADEAGCHIITATSEILNKLPLIGKDLEEYSLETVRMFRDDAVRAALVVDGAGPEE